MSRKQVALTFIFSFLVLLLGGTVLIQNGAITFMAQGQTSNSNTIVNGSPDANITIQSPENLTYNKNNISLAFTIETSTPRGAINVSGWGPTFIYGVALDYNISNVVSQVVNNVYQTNEFPDNVLASLTSIQNNLYAGNATLKGLSQGYHNITVWEAVYWGMISYSYYQASIFSTVSFNIDSIPPHITILSPETKVYHTSNVPLDFTVNKAVSQISYSLDGHQNITTEGNITLTRLANGLHKVTIYATDAYGNMGASQTVSFTVSKPESFPTSVVIAVILVAAAISVSLLIYRRHRKSASFME